MTAIWEKVPGWEYDLLRLLPPDEAREVWQRAARKGYARLIRRWWFWLLLFLLSAPLSTGVMIIWGFAGMLGLGWFGRLLAELVVHLCLAAVVHPVYFRLVPRLLRSLIREELLLLAAQQLSGRRETPPSGRPLNDPCP